MAQFSSRRTLLKLALLSSIPGLTYPLFAAVSEEKKQKRGEIIDVHHHIIPELYTTSLQKIGITETNGAPFPQWTPQKSLDAMDRNGIGTAITSISSPGIYFGDIAFTIDLARRCNEFSANLISSNPKRFGGFAVLPLPDVDASLKEIEYALDTLKLDGIVLLTNVDGAYLGTPEFNDVYTELNKRRAKVYVHPTEPAAGKFPKMAMPPSFLEFIFDTTRAVANLIQYNTLGQFPDIRFIISHAGGTAPYLTWKMKLIARYGSGDNQHVIKQLQSLYYDTALSSSKYSLDLLQNLVGSDHIVFGSDFPFAPEIVTSTSIYELNDYDGFDDLKRKAVYRKNLLELFPRITS